MSRVSNVCTNGNLEISFQHNSTFWTRFSTSFFIYFCWPCHCSSLYVNRGIVYCRPSVKRLESLFRTKCQTVWNSSYLPYLQTILLPMTVSRAHEIEIYLSAVRLWHRLYLHLQCTYTFRRMPLFSHVGCFAKYWTFAYTVRSGQPSRSPTKWLGWNSKSLF